MHGHGGILELTVLTFCLLLVAALVSLATKRIRLPLSVALVLLGLGVGTASRFVEEGSGLFRGAVAALRDFQLTPELILFIFLPTLLFESAYNMEARRVFQNLVPILTLAIPGLLLSTAVVGGLLHVFLGLDLLPALLFGSMISATDPVAVIAIFKEVGAPKRLVTLVEGESLFNDATAIVFFGLIYGLIQGLAASPVLVLGRFLLVFLGGAGVGLVLAVLFAKLIERVENDPLVEITLTTVLAYLSFILSDHFLHVSGVMATVAAGMTLGSYGRTKISPPVLEFMHSFWEYLAFVANAIIFLLVGLFLPGTVSGLAAGSWLGPVLLAVVLCTGARAIAIFGFLPLLGRLGWCEPVGGRYLPVMFWGGLRGAVALTLALSLLGREALPPALSQFLVVLTAGVVLFTLVVNALTIRPLVHWLGLDRETRAERLLRAESMIAVQRDVQHGLQNLRVAGFLLPRILENLIRTVQLRRATLKDAVEEESELSDAELLAIHRIQLLSLKKKQYLRLHAEGLLSEAATRQLRHEADQAADALRRGRPWSQDRSGTLRRPLVRLLERVPWLRVLGRRLSILQVAHAYELASGEMLTGRAVLGELSRFREADALPPLIHHTLREETVARVRDMEREMDEIADQFPEYVAKVQELVAHRIMLRTEEEGYRHLMEDGILTPEAFERLHGDLSDRYRTVRHAPVEALDLTPRSLLASVPMFAGLAEEDLSALAALLQPRSCVKGEILFREGEKGDTMYLVGRGVVKVWRGTEEDKIPIATLPAGSFVGEMALLHPAPRTATVETVTVASLLELRKADLDRVLEAYPKVRETLELAYAERRAMLKELERSLLEASAGGM